MVTEKSSPIKMDSSAKKKKFRLNSLDIFRGIAVIYMLFGHTSILWLNSESIWFYAAGILAGGVFGANTFIFLSGISFSISYQSKKKKIVNDPSYSTSQGRLNIIIKTIWLIILAIITNLIGTSVTQSIPMVWVWLVFQTLAFSRVICYPFLQVKPFYRILIGIFIFCFTESLQIILNSSHLFINEVFFNILFGGPYDIFPFPFVGFFLIGSSIGEYIFQWQEGKNTIGNSETRKSMIPKIISPKNLLIIGFILITLSILSGSQLTSESGLISYLSSISISELPRYIIGGTTPWCFFNLGGELIILSLFIHKDLNNKKYRRKTNYFRKIKNIKIRLPNGMIFVGKYSLSIFLVHYVCYFLFHNILTVWQYIFAFTFFSIILLCILYFWVKICKGKIMLEYLISYSTSKIAEEISFIISKRTSNV